MHFKQQMSLEDVRTTSEMIAPMVNRTPVILSEELSQAASSADLNIRFFLKCESMQKSGSFKYRGACSFISQQSDAALQRGLVATSTGNFGQAVALASKNAAKARMMKIDTSVVLPLTSPVTKINGARRNGATVVLAGTDPLDREASAKQIMATTGATLVGPMDDRNIVLGQATATLEMVQQADELYGERLDAIVAPSATGGLLAGAAIVCEGTQTLLFGCEPAKGGPGLFHSLESGVQSRPMNQNTVADGLRASTAKGNFELIRQKRLGIYTVSEQGIKDAWRLTMEQLKMIVEPSSAVAIATVLFNDAFRAMLAEQKKDWNIGIILTGGNTTVERIVFELSA